jgi:hypothetical protein
MQMNTLYSLFNEICVSDIKTVRLKFVLPYFRPIAHVYSARSVQYIFKTGKPIPIKPLFDTLFPTVYMSPPYFYSVEANFGNNLVKKPFRFNINSLQLELE